MQVSQAAFSRLTSHPSGAYEHDIDAIGDIEELLDQFNSDLNPPEWQDLNITAHTSADGAAWHSPAPGTSIDMPTVLTLSPAARIASPRGTSAAANHEFDSLHSEAGTATAAAAVAAATGQQAGLQPELAAMQLPEQTNHWHGLSVLPASVEMEQLGFSSSAPFMQLDQGLLGLPVLQGGLQPLPGGCVFSITGTQQHLVSQQQQQHQQPQALLSESLQDATNLSYIQSPQYTAGLVMQQQQGILQPSNRPTPLQLPPEVPLGGFLQLLNSSPAAVAGTAATAAELAQQDSGRCPRHGTSKAAKQQRQSRRGTQPLTQQEPNSQPQPDDQQGAGSSSSTQQPYKPKAPFIPRVLSLSEHQQQSRMIDCMNVEPVTFLEVPQEMLGSSAGGVRKNPNPRVSKRPSAGRTSNNSTAGESSQAANADEGSKITAGSGGGGGRYGMGVGAVAKMVNKTLEHQKVRGKARVNLQHQFKVWQELSKNEATTVTGAQLPAGTAHSSNTVNQQALTQHTVPPLAATAGVPAADQPQQATSAAVASPEAAAGTTPPADGADEASLAFTTSNELAEAVELAFLSENSSHFLELNRMDEQKDHRHMRLIHGPQPTVPADTHTAGKNRGKQGPPAQPREQEAGEVAGTSEHESAAQKRAKLERQHSKAWAQLIRSRPIGEATQIAQVAMRVSEVLQLQLHPRTLESAKQRADVAAAVFRFETRRREKAEAYAAQYQQLYERLAASGLTSQHVDVVQVSAALEQQAALPGQQHCNYLQQQHQQRAPTTTTCSGNASVTTAAAAPTVQPAAVESGGNLVPGATAAASAACLASMPVAEAGLPQPNVPCRGLEQCSSTSSSGCLDALAQVSISIPAQHQQQTKTGIHQDLPDAQCTIVRVPGHKTKACVSLQLHQDQAAAATANRAGILKQPQVCISGGTTSGSSRTQHPTELGDLQLQQTAGQQPVSSGTPPVTAAVGQHIATIGVQQQQQQQQQQQAPVGIEQQQPLQLPVGLTAADHPLLAAAAAAVNYIRATIANPGQPLSHPLSAAAFGLLKKAMPTPAAAALANPADQRSLVSKTQQPAGLPVAPSRQSQRLRQQASAAAPEPSRKRNRLGECDQGDVLLQKDELAIGQQTAAGDAAAAGCKETPAASPATGTAAEPGEVPSVDNVVFDAEDSSCDLPAYGREPPRLTKRRKTCAAEAPCKEVPITLDMLQQCYDMKMSVVAKKLQVCLTVLKKYCRDCGIKRWPCRKRRSILALKQEVEEWGRTSGCVKQANEMSEKLQGFLQELTEDPNKELDDRVKRLRQAVFKQQHKARRRVLQKMAKSSKADTDNDEEELIAED